MATTRTAKTTWQGSLAEGAGSVELQSSGVGSFDVSWPSRSEEANGKTSPEELIAAAHSSCFSMALSAGLSKAGTPPTTLETSAEVELTVGTGITGIKITVRGTVEGITEEQFVEAAEAAAPTTHEGPAPWQMLGGRPFGVRRWVPGAGCRIRRRRSRGAPWPPARRRPRSPRGATPRAGRRGSRCPRRRSGP